MFLLSSLVYLVGLKLDNFINWHWYYVFTPVWIFDVMLLVILGCIIYFWVDHSEELTTAMQKSFPLVTTATSSLIMSSIIICVLVFTGLLSAKLDSVQIVQNWSWWAIYSPLFYLCILVTVLPFVMIAKRGWVWSGFWGIFLVVSYDLTILLIIAKLEQNISGDWCLIFLPWWISDVFALVCAVSLCMELHTLRLGWCITVIYAGYMASIITFRSLLCVNLGSVCGDPIGYSYNLIFISFHIFILSFGMPIILFIRRRWENKETN